MTKNTCHSTSKERGKPPRGMCKDFNRWPVHGLRVSTRRRVPRPGWYLAVRHTRSSPTARRDRHKAHGTTHGLSNMLGHKPTILNIIYNYDYPCNYNPTAVSKRTVVSELSLSVESFLFSFVNSYLLNECFENMFCGVIGDVASTSSVHVIIRCATLQVVERARVVVWNAASSNPGWGVDLNPSCRWYWSNWYHCRKVNGSCPMDRLTPARGMWNFHHRLKAVNRSKKTH